MILPPRSMTRTLAFARACKSIQRQLLSRAQQNQFLRRIFQIVFSYGNLVNELGSRCGLSSAARQTAYCSMKAIGQCCTYPTYLELLNSPLSAALSRSDGPAQIAVQIGDGLAAFCACNLLSRFRDDKPMKRLVRRHFLGRHLQPGCRSASVKV
nr:hypothetical protein CFP56_30211 [Quercus suber]